MIYLYTIIWYESQQNNTIDIFMTNKILPDGELNPGLPRDRRGYSPLYYRGFDGIYLFMIETLYSKKYLYIYILNFCICMSLFTCINFTLAKINFYNSVINMVYRNTYSCSHIKN